MDFRLKREELKKEYKQLVNDKNGLELRKIGCDSNIMSEHNLLSEAYLKAATNFGINEAYTDLGVLYNHHFEVPDYVRGFENYLISARLGDTLAISLYVRDSAWFEYDKDLDEILDLAMKFKEPSGISEYAFKLINEGKIEEGMCILETIQYEDPKVLIELAVLDIQESKDVDIILDKLIRFNEYWYKDILRENQWGGLGDNNWFFYYYINEEEPAMEYFRLLPMILKAAADEGNTRAAFAYCVFSIAGICMSESNMEDYEIYVKKVFEGDIENKGAILKFMDDHKEFDEFEVIDLDELEIESDE